jgi:hypothetical protein
LDPNQIPIIANAIFLVVFLLVKWRSTWTPIVVFGIWCTALITYEYVYAFAIGGFGLAYNILGLNLPLYTFPVFCFSLLMLGRRQGLPPAFRNIVILAVAYLFALFRPVIAYAGVTTDVGSLGEQNIWQIILTVALVASVLLPLANFVTLGQTAWSQWFRIDISRKSEIVKPIVWAGAIFLLSLVVGNVLLRGYVFRLLNFGLYAHPVLYVLVFATSLTLVDHFICFGLGKATLDSFFPNETTNVLEIVGLAVLFAGIRYYCTPVYLAREFIFGLVYSFLYVRTRSLSYGLLFGVVGRLISG